MIAPVVAAFGGTPVVTEGPPPADAAAVVAVRTGLPADQLDPVGLDALVARRPVAVVGTGTFRRCAGTPSTNADVAAELARAQAAFDGGDLGESWTRLDLAVVELGCLSEVAAPTTAAQAFSLRAKVRAARGEPAAEEQAAAAAFSSAPAGTTPIAVVGAGTVGPWLDGRSLTSTVVPGLHLLQFPEAGAVRSGWLTVGGPVTIVFPGGVTRPVLDGLGDAARRPVVEAVLRATVDAPAAYVSAGGLWLVELSEPVRTTELVAPPPAPAPLPEPTKRRRR